MLHVSHEVNRSVERADTGSVNVQTSLFAIKDLLKRQFPIIVCVALICVGMAVVYLLTATPRYSSSAVLLIDSRKTQMLQQQSPMGVDAPLDSATVDSQVEILKSEKVARAVIKDLNLVHSPEFVGGGGGVMSTLMGFFSGAAPSESFIERSILSRFDRDLTVKRRALSYVIEVSFKARDPELASRIANAVAEAYIVDALESKYQASRRAAVWLQERLKELRAQSSAADRAVVEFKAKNNIIDAGGRLLNEQQLAETNSALTIAKAQTAEAQARLDRISSIFTNENKDVGALFNDIATVADSLRNDVITRLRQQYLDLASREADWSKRYGPEHLAVTNLRNQMREIRRSINDELGRIGETYKSDLAIAKAREASVQSSLNTTIEQSNDTGQAQIVLRELESNAQSTRALSDNFLQLYMVSVQQQSFPMTEARVITDASPPISKSEPKSSIILLGALAGGCLLGFAVGWMRDVFDRVFRSDADVESLLGLSCIATIPKIGSSSVSDRLPRRLKSLGGLLRHDKDNPESPPNGPEGEGEASRTFQSDSLISQVQLAPFSRYTEAIRSLKIAVDVLRLDSSSKVFGIISTLPNEGKTTISASFAQLIAMGGNRTILVDADLRNPSLSSLLAPKGQAGLVDVLLNNKPLSEVVMHDPSTGLDFLPAGVSGRLSQTSEMLSSLVMLKLFTHLRETYDWIIVDLSPLAPVVDVRATSQFIDGYILVVEWGKTNIESVQHALKDAAIVKDRTIGAVLNKADFGVLKRYQSYGSEYYGSQYGATD